MCVFELALSFQRPSVLPFSAHKKVCLSLSFSPISLPPFLLPPISLCFSPTVMKFLYTFIAHEQVHEALDQMLAAARAENERMRETMGEMGVSPRP